MVLFSHKAYKAHDQHSKIFQWCNRGSYILGITNSFLIGHKAHSIGGNTYLNYKPSQLSVVGEVNDHRGKPTIATFLNQYDSQPYSKYLIFVSTEKYSSHPSSKKLLL